jgi:hypothetical protein
MSSLTSITNAPEPNSASEPEEGYLVWGAGLLPPVFVRPIFVSRAPRP